MTNLSVIFDHCGFPVCNFWRLDFEIVKVIWQKFLSLILDFFKTVFYLPSPALVSVTLFLVNQVDSASKSGHLPNRLVLWVEQGVSSKLFVPSEFVHN